jgi:hypothetical protein
MCMRVRLFSRIVFLIPCLIAGWPTPHLSAGEAKTATTTASNPFAIPGIDRLVEAATTEVKRSGDRFRIAAFDDVRDVMAHASEWIWYSRDNGVLLAIPVRERLGIAAKVEGEKALADVVRRLINQAGWGNPPVQVVLIEPDEPRFVPKHGRPCKPIPSAAISCCGCD